MDEEALTRAPLHTPESALFAREAPLRGSKQLATNQLQALPAARHVRRRQPLHGGRHSYLFHSNQIASAATRVFHPNGRHAYLLHELDATIGVLPTTLSAVP